ncbi:outer membrane lipoprotein carrier protein LolA [Flavobacteriales bacterium]|nr:outer membrane lipoprotein carrier protein LolA [Flavobacteriales bacterium]
MKNILLFLAIATFSFTAIGQEKYTDKDPKAKAVLDKLSAKHKSIDNIVIDFSATFSGVKIKSQTLTGTAYKSGKKYAYYTPDYKVINDGRSNWLFVKAENEVTISSNEDADEESGLMSPTELLSIWEKGFKYKFIGEGKVGSKTLQEIRLFPTNPKKSKYHTITLIIDKGANELHKLEIKGRDGVNMVYKIKGFKSGIAISGSKFKFDKSKYPNCTVNDLRF